jgi:deoxyribose-phosphate aldolase
MYSHDIGDLPPAMSKTLFETLPDIVVQPRSIDEMRKVLAFANERKIPVIPRGAASWGFGGVVPTRGGIVIDLSPFRRILTLDANRKTVTVEAGAREIDVVIARNYVLTGDWKSLYDEIKQFRAACGDAHMKTILATGDLGTLKQVYQASLVAMMAGSDV